jgi:hypothetical protein
MPPDGRLGDEEVRALRRWVAAGAPWFGPDLEPVESQAGRAGRDWWSLRPIAPVSLPPLASDPDAPPGARVVDAFLRRELRRQSLDFAPLDTRARLIRRLTFDLHGLPPAWDEIRAFEEDRAPGATARVVDRLLASPRYGERMARRWLDVARFAESDGYEHDMPRPHAWPYRDWVIDAFNRDLPYPEFVREQLAGDALHPGQPGAAIPTGFLVAGCFDAVGAKQASLQMRAEGRQDELEDMIGTTAQAFLGLTVQCARCHDHKHDPIPQEDYYRFQAALAGARHYGPDRRHEHYAVRSETPPVVRILARGSVLSPGRLVLPGGLCALPEVPWPPGLPDAPDPERRRRLAAWITHPRNPLLARTVTNRAWGWVFGRALAATPNDLGFQGERPSHPELLEWLAGEFVREGFSVKRLLRTLLLTRAYRQSSAWNEAASRVDAENRLLWRRSPRRLESDEIRDAILAVSGALNTCRGGPGFALFTWTENAGALYRPADPEGPEFCRRSIYRTVVRGLEAPILAAFDCPDPSATTPRRQSTTTPLQALALMNSRFVDRQSRVLAARLQRDTSPPEPEAWVRAACRLALGREPAPREVARGAAFIRRHDLRAWCRVLYNHAEFIHLD